MSDMRSHTVTWDASAMPAQTGARGGLEMMQESIDRGARRSPISALMDFRLVKVEPGLAVLECLPGEQHTNPIGVVHGGFAATVLDAALWSAVNTTIEAGSLHTTLELKVNYLRAITAAAGPMTCEARVLSRGRRVALAEAKLFGADGTLHAHGTSTLMIMARAA